MGSSFMDHEVAWAWQSYSQFASLALKLLLWVTVDCHHCCCPTQSVKWSVSWMCCTVQTAMLRSIPAWSGCYGMRWEFRCAMKAPPAIILKSASLQWGSLGTGWASVSCLPAFAWIGFGSLAHCVTSCSWSMAYCKWIQKLSGLWRKLALEPCVEWECLGWCSSSSYHCCCYIY